MHTIHAKLVRDGIPDIIRTNGDIPIYHIASDEEYRELLKKKLQEEVQEYLTDPSAEELADMLEVIYSLLSFHNISTDALEVIRQKKWKERGGFKNKIVLDETKNNK